MIGGCFVIFFFSRMKIKSSIVSFGFTLRFIGAMNLSSLSNLELEPAHIMTKATTRIKHTSTLSSLQNGLAFLIKFILLIGSEFKRIYVLGEVKL
jgi:hypothetical protein